MFKKHLFRNFVLVSKTSWLFLANITRLLRFFAWIALVSESGKTVTRTDLMLSSFIFIEFKHSRDSEKTRDLSQHWRPRLYNVDLTNRGWCSQGWTIKICLISVLAGEWISCQLYIQSISGCKLDLSSQILDIQINIQALLGLIPDRRPDIPDLLMLLKSVKICCVPN